MKNMRVLLAVAAIAVSGLTMVNSAQAAVTFNFNVGQSVTSGTLIQGFDVPATPAGLVGSNFVIHAASPNDSTGAAPNSSGTSYLAVLAGGSATYTLPTPVTALQFDWGTASADNVLTVYTTDNTAGTMFTVPASSTTGANYNKNGLATVFSTTGAITALKFAATNNSFEADSISTSAVPEPASWAMMIGGVGLVGGAMRRRRVAGQQLSIA